MTPEQKRLTVQSMYADGHSKQAIAASVGITRQYVHLILKEAEMLDPGRADERKHRKKPVSDWSLRLGQRIQSIRHLDRGMERAELGKECGVYWGRLSRIERGLTDVGAYELKKIADALGVELSALFPEDA